MKRLTCCLALLLILPLVGCEKDEDSEPVRGEAVGPAPTSAPAPTDTAQPAVSGERPGDDAPGAVVPPNPSGTNPPVVTDAGTVISDAGTTKDAGAPAAKDAGGSGGKNNLASCLASCEGSLRGCLTPGKDGGIGLPNLPKCQAAAEACRKACTP